MNTSNSNNKNDDTMDDNNKNNKRQKLSHGISGMTTQQQHQSIAPLSASSSDNDNDTTDEEAAATAAAVGRLEELKQQEASLAAQLAAVRREKLSALQSRPLTIGIIGYGRFGQFIARAFTKHGHNVVVTSRSDYTDIAKAMNARYIPLDRPQDFYAHNLDVIVFCVSILSFEETVRNTLPYLERDLAQRTKGPLVVDVLSVKEHPRQILLNLLPPKVDLLLTHPMFGPDSGKNGWHGLNFVYEKTRIDGVVLDPEQQTQQSHAGHHHHHHHHHQLGQQVARRQGKNHNGNKDNDDDAISTAFVDATGTVHSVHEHSEAHVESVDRIERFLSIWEEEGCEMVPMSCREHDAHAANSQFITHLMGRILGSQGLKKTPIDTSGFKNVLKLVDSTTADSFDLFYGLFKFNQNSHHTITNLRTALDDVVTRLENKEKEEEALQQQQKDQQRQQQQSQAEETASPQPKQKQTPSKVKN